MTEKSNAAAESEIPELKPLYPQYDESSHSPYVKRLEKALQGEDTKIHNIALSGVYGSGKSSILEKVVKDLEEERPHTTRTISLAPLAAQLKEQDDRKVNSVSDEGDSTPEESGTSPESSKPSSITNLIQKEIIKQLLYGTVIWPDFCSALIVGRLAPLGLHNTRFRSVPVSCSPRTGADASSSTTRPTGTSPIPGPSNPGRACVTRRARSCTRR